MKAVDENTLFIDTLFHISKSSVIFSTNLPLCLRFNYSPTLNASAHSVALLKRVEEQLAVAAHIGNLSSASFS